MRKTELLTNGRFILLDDELYDSDPSKQKLMLTDELSDISDEDFGDTNANNNSIRTKKVGTAFLLSSLSPLLDTDPGEFGYRIYCRETTGY